MDNTISVLYTILLSVLICFFIFSAKKLVENDIYISIVYFFLFYMPFSLLTVYLYSPKDLIYSNGIISGVFDIHRTGWLGMYIFLFASLFCFWVVTKRGITKKKQLRHILIIPGVFHTRVSLVLVYFATASILALFLKNYKYINYWNFNNEAFRDSHSSFDLLCNIMITLCVILSTQLALIICGSEEWKYRKIEYALPFVTLLILLSIYLFKTGDRSSIIALVLGIFVPKIIDKQQTYKVIKYLLYLFLCYLLMQVLFMYSRQEEAFTSILEIFFPTGIYRNAIAMFASIRFNYVNFKEALFSVITKSIVRTKTDYIYALICHLFTDVKWDGINGFGYHLFTDAFVLFGYFGFIFNGIVIGKLVLFWRKLADSNDHDFNIVAMSYISSHALSIVRGQGTCYLIKYLYTDFLLCVTLYLLLGGRRIVFSLQGDNNDEWEDWL